VHDADELERALELECECVGVNCRDLRTFEVSLERAAELAAKLPRNVVRVAESGLHTAEDLRRMKAAGYDAFLIGESLMRQARPGEALRALIEESLR
jgi:indole-3-glycerol phosphate synthase